MWPGLCVIANGGLRLHQRRLRRHAARPEHRHLAGSNLHRVAEIRLRHIPNADRGRVAEVDRCAVRAREARADLRRLHRLRGVSGRIDTTIGPRNRPAGRHAMFVRYIGTFTSCSMCRTGTPGRQQCVLERERAADHERHEVVAPVVARRRSAPRPVRRSARRGTPAGRCGGRARGDDLRLRVARFGHVEQRARLRVPLAEQQEVERPVASEGSRGSPARTRARGRASAG